MPMFIKKQMRQTNVLFRSLRLKEGFTLIELIVVVAIVGILAAIAIPSFTAYIKNSRLSEAQSNIQGIIQAEQVYFTRFQRYTPSLPTCPPAPVGVSGKTQVFDPVQCDQGMADGWVQLGWRPEGGVYFQYQVFTAYPVGYGANSNLLLLMPAVVLGGNANLFGVNWNESVALPGLQQPPPWFAIQTWADTDNDGRQVFLRSNSVNGKVYRFPDPRVDPTY